jgi:chromosome segregation ATPase
MSCVPGGDPRRGDGRKKSRSARRSTDPRQELPREVAWIRRRAADLEAAVATLQRHHEIESRRVAGIDDQIRQLKRALERLTDTVQTLTARLRRKPQ